MFEDTFHSFLWQFYNLENGLKLFLLMNAAMSGQENCIKMKKKPKFVQKKKLAWKSLIFFIFR